MRMKRAAAALVTLSALLPAIAAAAEQNPFVPPPPHPPPSAETAGGLDEERVKALVEKLLQDANRKQGGAEGSGAAADAADRTVGAAFIACDGGVPLWREEKSAGPAGTADVKFGVTFYATPRPPVRNPCAE